MLLLVWNIALTLAVGWGFISGMWGVGKQLDQINSTLDYRLERIDSALGNIDWSLYHIERELKY